MYIKTNNLLATTETRLAFPTSNGMKLGTKINLILLVVIVVVIATGFLIIERTESKNIQDQVMSNANSVTELVRQDLERVAIQSSRQKESVYATVNTLMMQTPALNYIKIFDNKGVLVASTSVAYIASPVESDRNLFEETIKNKVSISRTRLNGAHNEMEYYAPIVDGNNEVMGVVGLNIKTPSLKPRDVADTEHLALLLTEQVGHEAQAVITAIKQGLQEQQKIIDDAFRFGETAKNAKLNTFYGLVVFDRDLNITVISGAGTEFVNSVPAYIQTRKDLFLGARDYASYDRTDKEGSVIVRVDPIYSNTANVATGDATGEILPDAVLEVYVMKSAYMDRINEFQVRLVGIGIVFTAILTIVLAVILERQVVGPIRRFSVVAQKIAAGDLNQKVEHTAKDEIGQFGDVFNSMVANFRELDRLKSDFISVAAHQLRTPLSGLKWVLKLVLDGDLGPINEEQKSMLTNGFDTNEKMIQLVNDLLNVSRIENAKFGYDFKKSDFMKLLNTLIENTALTSKQRSIEVQLVNNAGEIPEFMFDPDKLAIALQNIVDNALKYTLSGGKVIIAVEKKGDYIEVKVSDTGVGVPSADIPKLFSKFFRASNVIHLQTDGSGLGLFIVKSIITRHGGQIKVESVEGKGTTIIVTVPTLESLIPKDEGVVGM